VSEESEPATDGVNVPLSRMQVARLMARQVVAVQITETYDAAGAQLADRPVTLFLRLKEDQPPARCRACGVPMEYEESELRYASADGPYCHATATHQHEPRR